MDAVKLAGLEARAYVMGGMTPSTMEGVTRTAQLFIKSGYPSLAVQLFRGWAVHQAKPASEPLVWHRFLGRTRIEVSA